MISLKQNPFLSLLILALVFFTFSECKEDKDVDELSGTLSTLSYNVAGLPNGISSSDPVRYMTLISPSMNDFDIVHVQEDFCFHDSLMLYNNMPYTTEPTPCIGSGLNTFSKYPIKNFEREVWTDCTYADCYSLKGFSYSKIELAKGVTIDFYNVHCNAGSNELSAAARRANMLQMLSYIEQKSAGEPIVIMGDFNNKYTRAVDTIRIMQSLGFTDAWIELIRGGELPVQNEIALNDCYPTSTSTSCEGVDKFFYRGTDEMKLQALSFQYGDDVRFFYEGNDTLPLSDHEPLMVNLSYEFKRK